MSFLSHLVSAGTGALSAVAHSVSPLGGLALGASTLAAPLVAGGIARIVHKISGDTKIHAQNVHSDVIRPDGSRDYSRPVSRSLASRIGGFISHHKTLFGAAGIAIPAVGAALTGYAALRGLGHVANGLGKLLGRHHSETANAVVSTPHDADATHQETPISQAVAEVISRGDYPEFYELLVGDATIPPVSAQPVSSQHRQLLVKRFSDAQGYVGRLTSPVSGAVIVSFPRPVHCVTGIYSVGGNAVNAVNASVIGDDANYGLRDYFENLAKSTSSAELTKAMRETDSETRVVHGTRFHPGGDHGGTLSFSWSDSGQSPVQTSLYMPRYTLPPTTTLPTDSPLTLTIRHTDHSTFQGSLAGSLGDYVLGVLYWVFYSPGDGDTISNIQVVSDQVRAGRTAAYDVIGSSTVRFMFPPRTTDWYIAGLWITPPLDIPVASTVTTFPIYINNFSPVWNTASGEAETAAAAYTTLLASGYLLEFGLAASSIPAPKAEFWDGSAFQAVTTSTPLDALALRVHRSVSQPIDGALARYVAGSGEGISALTSILHTLNGVKPGVDTAIARVMFGTKNPTAAQRDFALHPFHWFGEPHFYRSVRTPVPSPANLSHLAVMLPSTLAAAASSQDVLSRLSA